MVNNVFTQIGRSKPTDRNIAHGVYISDWKSGLVSNNVFTQYGGNDDINNTRAIISQGDMESDSVIDGNIAFGLEGSKGMFYFRDYDDRSGLTESHAPITFTNNELYTTSNEMYPLEINYSEAANSVFGGNYYYTQADSDSWFQYFNDKQGVPTEQAYRDALSDETSVFGRKDYVDPDRSFSTYASLLGYASADALIDAILLQRRGNWNDQFTAQVINDYIREGFCIQGNTECR